MKSKSSRNNNKQRRNKRPRTQSTMPTSSVGSRILLGSGLDSRINQMSRSGYIDIPIQAGATYTTGLSFGLTGFYTNSVFNTWPAGSTDLASLYDFYRIERVQVSFLFNNNFSPVSTTSTTLPYLFTAIDYNDNTVTGISDITQRNTCEVTLCSNASGIIATRTLVPRAQLLTFATSLLSGYSEAPQGTWYNASSVNVQQHYGLKFGVDATQMTNITGNIGTLRVFVKTFFSCKECK